ncbi:hypothetical protein GQ607_002485 [Colletotrichum asianum]|uniref:Uncharacterized protein n=1 Tax=Colletotrichum asianum TaxID=702518 RepID=A0A8H3WP29_9PEZI|nr:hypothetical protein GQ607_002485 [Colletotrichum asianum]
MFGAWEYDSVYGTMARRGSGSDPPLGAEPSSMSLTSCRRTSSSQTFPETQRETQRLSFKTALRLIIPDGSMDTPASWDGSSTPKPALADGYFGKQAMPGSPATPHSMNRSTPTSTASQQSPGSYLATPQRGSNFDPPRPPKEGFE